MENDVLSVETEKGAHRGVPYPFDSIQNSLSVIDTLVAENGTTVVITKEDISRVTGKKTNSLTLTFSTFQQYGLLEKVHGRGFLPTTLYKKYHEKVYDHHEKEALLEIFKKPPLYTQILDTLNNTILPSEEKFPSLLKNEPYGLNPNSSNKASKIFFENLGFLKIIDSNNKLVYGKVEDKFIDKNKTQAYINLENNNELFELPIPLGGSRKAYLKYPLADLKKKDIVIIAKALNFVASSLIDEDGVTDFEIVIKDLEKTKGT